MWLNNSCSHSSITRRLCTRIYPNSSGWPPGARTTTVQLSATRCSCIAILWVSLVNFAIITLCVASQRVFTFVSVYFIMTQSGNFWIHPRTTDEKKEWDKDCSQDSGKNFICCMKKVISLSPNPRWWPLDKQIWNVFHPFPQSKTHVSSPYITNGKIIFRLCWSSSFRMVTTFDTNKSKHFQHLLLSKNDKVCLNSAWNASVITWKFHLKKMEDKGQQQHVT
jgi:hypothetical protein